MAQLSYKCLEAYQRANGHSPRFVLFYANACDVLKWSAIRRHTDATPDGSQRLEKPYKVTAIKSFFEAGDENTIPTAIVVGFEPGKTRFEAIPGCAGLFELILEFDDAMREEDKPGTIVDGQHRLLGMSKFGSPLIVPVVGLLDVSDAETAFQFVVINNKASRVSSDHLRSLALQFEEGALAERLTKVRLNLNPSLRFVGFANELEDSPFRGILALPKNPEGQQLVPPAAIEDAVNFIRQQKLPDLVDDDDMLIGVFFTIWRVIKEQWGTQWRAGGKLLTKVSVVCLTQFIVQNLLRAYDWASLNIFDPKEVEDETRKIVSALNPLFWDAATTWTAKGLDTSTGRKVLLDSLEQMVRNERQKIPWNNDIGMIQREEIENGSAPGGAE
jgi:DGQHR domain-containing protein